jgi:anti-sigma B factor antagonist
VVNINQIAEELSDIVEKKNYTRLLLNLTNVEYLSSAVLAKLIGLHKRLKELRGELRVCSVRDSIMEVFRITKLDKVFDIQRTEEEGLARFKVRGF